MKSWQLRMVSWIAAACFLGALTLFFQSSLGFQLIYPDATFYLWWEETRQTTKPTSPSPMLFAEEKARAWQAYEETRPVRSTPWNPVDEPMWARAGFLPTEVRDRIPPDGRIEEQLYTAAFRKAVDWDGCRINLDDGRIRDAKERVLRFDDKGFAEALFEKFKSESLPPPRILSETEHTMVRQSFPGQHAYFHIIRYATPINMDAAANPNDARNMLCALYSLLTNFGWYLVGVCVLIGLTASLWHRPANPAAGGPS